MKMLEEQVNELRKNMLENSDILKLQELKVIKKESGLDCLLGYGLAVSCIAAGLSELCEAGLYYASLAYAIPGAFAFQYGLENGIRYDLAKAKLQRIKSKIFGE